MEMLQSIFPNVPPPVLQTVLRICGDNIEAASHWMLENDWRDLENPSGDNMGDNEYTQRRHESNENGGSQSEQGNEGEGNHGEVSEMNRNGPPNTTQSFGNFIDEEGGMEDEDDEDDEDEDDDDEDDDDEDDDTLDDDDDDTGDDEYFTSRIAPLAKRRKIEVTSEGKIDKKEERFWIRFDDQIVQKSLIEMLNISLSKLAHGEAILSNTNTNKMDKKSAEKLLKSVIKPIEQNKIDSNNASASTSSTIDPESSTDVQITDNTNSSSTSPITSSSSTAPPTDSSTISTKSSVSSSSQASSSNDENSNPSEHLLGFWCYFFNISELDMIWRSILNAHLFNKRFGDVLEFHTALGGGLNVHGFDELMHYHTESNTNFGQSLTPRRTDVFRCCLILPCHNEEKEIFRVGKFVHTILNLKDPLYYRVLRTEDSHKSKDSIPNVLDEDMKMSEGYHERNSDYRILRVEKQPSTEHDDESSKKKSGLLTYQPGKSVSYALQYLQETGWTACDLK